MKAPSGFSSKFKPREGCRLKKALYGLKQSSRAWFGRFTAAMTKFGYIGKATPTIPCFLRDKMIVYMLNYIC